MCLDARADGRQDVQPKDDSKLHLLCKAAIEFPEDCCSNDGQASIGEGIECFKVARRVSRHWEENNLHPANIP